MANKIDVDAVGASCWYWVLREQSVRAAEESSRRERTSLALALADKVPPGLVEDLELFRRVAKAKHYPHLRGCAVVTLCNILSVARVVWTCLSREDRHALCKVTLELALDLRADETSCAPSKAMADLPPLPTSALDTLLTVLLGVKSPGGGAEPESTVELHVASAAVVGALATRIRWFVEAQSDPLLRDQVPEVLPMMRSLHVLLWQLFNVCPRSSKKGSSSSSTTTTTTVVADCIVQFLYTDLSGGGGPGQEQEGVRFSARLSQVQLNALLCPSEERKYPHVASLLNLCLKSAVEAVRRWAYRCLFAVLGPSWERLGSLPCRILADAREEELNEGSDMQSMLSSMLWEAALVVPELRPELLRDLHLDAEGDQYQQLPNLLDDVSHFSTTERGRREAALHYAAELLLQLLREDDRAARGGQDDWGGAGQQHQEDGGGGGRGRRSSVGEALLTRLVGTEMWLRQKAKGATSPSTTAAREALACALAKAERQHGLSLRRLARRTVVSAAISFQALGILQQRLVSHAFPVEGRTEDWPRQHAALTKLSYGRGVLTRLRQLSEGRRTAAAAAEEDEEEGQGACPLESLALLLADVLDRGESRSTDVRRAAAWLLGEGRLDSEGHQRAPPGPRGRAPARESAPMAWAHRGGRV